MQVATLFRESATLLGATMEAGGGGANSPESTAPSVLAAGPLPMSYTSNFANHSLVSASINNKYKFRNVKVEPHDDGYETSADLISNTAKLNHKIKCEKLEDPYSFIDDDPIPMLPLPHGYLSGIASSHQLTIGPKKRGRKKKIKEELGPNPNLNGGIPRPTKERKKHDRFNGMPEEEVSKRTLPDHLTTNLDIIIIGINPGLFAAYKGHHYAGPGNHFWKCLYLSGLTKEQMTADEDYKLLQVGIGFTNMVQRPTKGSADLTRKEIKEGSQILLEKLRNFRPKIAVFNGKLIYEVFSGKKDFHFGRQPDCIEGTNTHMWVMPSSSARCAQLPRAADKVPFYAGLKKFRDYLNGLISHIDESEVVFSEPTLKACYEPEPKPEPDLIDLSNSVIKKEDGSLALCKKKRGRPKKVKLEGEEPRKPAVRRTSSHRNCDFPKKKRGRPKKMKLEEGERQATATPIESHVSRCFSNPSPIHSPNSYYHVSSEINSNNGSSSLYAPQTTPNYNQSPRSASYSQSPRPQYNQSPRPSFSQSPRPSFSQSPRPHSQSFTHSDLSSEISAAISSEQLGSPASPGLGPPDFEPPSNMADDVDCHFNSPASSTPSEQAHYSYPSSYSIEPLMENHFSAPRQSQDIASKSLSGLESLVDQIPSITEGDSTLTDSPEQFVSGHYTNINYNMPARTSPVPYSYSPSPSYPIYPTPTWTGHYEPMQLAYPQLPYAQGYSPNLHVPSANYPYYSYPQPTAAHPPGYPPYLGGF